MIQIDNLTQDQVDMLDMMWSLDSHASYMEWYDQLCNYDKQQADLLQRMVILAEVDSLVTEDLSLAKAVLARF